jgi:ribA/ribD-fused uncharacterized protein
MIEFYKTQGDYGCFSNFSRHPFKLKGFSWKTSEHYFQAQKFAGTALEGAVGECNKPSEAAIMGRDRKNPLRNDWESIKDDIMREAVYAKFTQDEQIQKVLLSTGDEKLVEHSSNDSYWADGGDGSGKNMLGIILMEVRDRIMKDKTNGND